MNKLNPRLLLFSLMMLLFFNATAGLRYWIGTGANINWNSTSNWSTTSGGASGAAVPGSTDSVYYDGNGTGQCSINATVSIMRFEMGTGYTDTVKQNAFSITVGTSGMILNGGTFSGGTLDITNQGIFTLGGCTFISTSSILSITGNYTFSSGTFAHNNGEVRFNTTSTISGNTTFYKLLFASTATYTISSSVTLTVLNELIMSGNGTLILNTGNIDAKGNITISNTSTSSTSGGTATITINGTSKQIFTGAGTIAQSLLCNITINKSSDTLVLKDHISVAGNWVYSQGIIDASTYSSNVVFSNGTRTISGNHTLNNISFYAVLGASVNTITSGDTLTVLGEIKNVGANEAIINSGTILGKGNITIANTSNSSTNHGGTATIVINGTTKQTINGAAISGAGRLCNIKIDKPNDTLVFKNVISVSGDWIYIAGIIDATTFNSTICFPYSTGRTVSGTHSLNNVHLYGSSTCTSAISSGDTLTVNGALSLSGSGAIVIGTGILQVKGDVNNTNTNTSASGTSTGTLLFSGTANQLFTGTGSNTAGRICNMEINKTGGVLSLKNTIVLGSDKDFTYVQGTIDISTYDSKLVFSRGSGTNINGTFTLKNVTFTSEGVSPGTFTLNPNDTLTVTGELRFEGNLHYATLTTGNIHAKGDIIITNTSTSNILPTAIIKICGTGDQTITGTATPYQGRLCNIDINKPSGTLFLKNAITISINCSWKLLNGNLDATTYSSTIAFARGAVGIEGNQTFHNLIFSTTNTATAIYNIPSTDTITVIGELKTEGNYAIGINGGIINVKGDINLTNTYTGNPASSSATINICGVGTQTFTGSGIVNAGKICNIKIDKPSGTLNLNSIITGLGSWEYVRGTVNAGTSTFVPYSTFSLDGQGITDPMYFHHLTLSTGTTTLNGTLVAVGNLTISTSTTLNGNSNEIYLGGNWINTGAFTYSESKVFFSGGTSGLGSTSQYIIKSGGTVNFHDLTISKPGGKVYLSCPVNVNNKLFLMEGHLVSDTSNLLSFPNGASIDKTYEGSDTSYICGPVKKTGNSIFVFPLGDSTLTTGAYHPITISAPTNVSDAFTAQYYASRHSDTVAVDTLQLSKCEYWNITRNAGTSNVITTLGWNSNNCIDTSSIDMVVAGRDGTNSIWKSLENSDVSITGDTGYVKASLTPFWNGTNPVPVTIAKKKSIDITEHVREPYCFPGATRGFVHIGVKYGAPPFSYQWSNTATTQDIDSLTAGTYSLTITDRYQRTFIKNYSLQNCVNWSTLPSNITTDTTGRLLKTSGDTSWATAQSSLILDSIQTGRWIKFMVADTASKFLIGFGAVIVDSLEEEPNLMMYMNGSQLTVIETDNDGFYSKEVIGTVSINDILKVELNETQGILYYKNDNLIHTGKLLSDARLQLTTNLYGSNKYIKNIRCSSNN